MLALSLLAARVFFLRKECRMHFNLVVGSYLLYLLLFFGDKRQNKNKQTQTQVLFDAFVCGAFASEPESREETKKIVQFPEVSLHVLRFTYKARVQSIGRLQHCSNQKCMCSGCNMHTNIYLVCVVRFSLAVYFVSIVCCASFVLAMPQWVRERENRKTEPK